MRASNYGDLATLETEAVETRAALATTNVPPAFTYVPPQAWGSSPAPTNSPSPSLTNNQPYSPFTPTNLASAQNWNQSPQYHSPPPHNTTQTQHQSPTASPASLSSSQIQTISSQVQNTMQELIRPLKEMHLSALSDLQDQRGEDLRQVKILNERMNANIRNVEDKHRETAHKADLFQAQTWQQLQQQATQAQESQQSMRDMLNLLKGVMENRSPTSSIPQAPPPPANVAPSNTGAPQPARSPPTPSQPSSAAAEGETPQ